MYRFTVPSILAKGGSEMKKHMTTVIATKAGEPEMLVSTPDADRDGDRLMAEGADLVSFRRNPVLMWSHSYSEIPIGRVEQITVAPGRGLAAKWRWLEQDPFADRVKNAWTQNVINAASVGFMPKEWKPNDFGGQDILAWDLLEISLCAVPANPFATRVLKDLRLLEDPRQDLFLDVSDCFPRQSEPSSLFRKENKMYRSSETVFDVDESQLRTLVEKGIREALGTAAFGTDDQTPDPFRKIRLQGEREELAHHNAKMEEIIWRAMAKVRGNIIIQREIDMELCPCPPPAVTIDLGYAVPSHIRYWPI